MRSQRDYCVLYLIPASDQALLEWIDEFIYPHRDIRRRRDIEIWGDLSRYFREVSIEAIYRLHGVASELYDEVRFQLEVHMGRDTDLLDPWDRDLWELKTQEIKWQSPLSISTLSDRRTHIVFGYEYRLLHITLDFYKEFEYIDSYRYSTEELRKLRRWRKIREADARE